jgi:diacylglycerol kinase (ATP)
VLCNGPREGGGFLIAPDAKIDDGILHYAMITDVSRAMMFRILPEVMKGTHGTIQRSQNGHVQKILAHRQTAPCTSTPTAKSFQVSGTDVRRVSFEILPNALAVVRG